jgi:arylformamidase
MTEFSGTDWIDISITLRNEMIAWPGDRGAGINRSMEISKGDLANLTHLDMSAHTGTHMDAPLHFMDDGRDISQIPLAAVMGKTRVIEITNVDEITVSDLKKHDIMKNERILFKTRNSNHAWDAKPFNENFVYLATEAAEYLAMTRVQTIGIDYLSISGYQKNEAPVHKAILGAGIWVIEGLNLMGIEPGNYELICLPLKILNGDGAPARAIIKQIK